MGGVRERADGMDVESFGRRGRNEVPGTWYGIDGPCPYREASMTTNGSVLLVNVWTMKEMTK